MEVHKVRRYSVNLRSDRKVEYAVNINEWETDLVHCGVLEHNKTEASRRTTTASNNKQTPNKTKQNNNSNNNGKKDHFKKKNRNNTRLNKPMFYVIVFLF